MNDDHDGDDTRMTRGKKSFGARMAQSRKGKRGTTRRKGRKKSSRY